VRYRRNGRLPTLTPIVAITTFAMSLVLVSCTRQRISAEITALFDDRHAATVDLSRVGPPGWDRVCILGPYTTDRSAEQILGFPWHTSRRSSIATNDGINLLVFVKGREVLAFAEHRRDKGDFLELATRCLARDRAVLVRRDSRTGHVQLVPQQDRAQ
jgi:hypothetical protein